MDIEGYAKQATTMPSDFGYHGSKDLGNTWGFTPFSEHRDSDVLEQSNFAVISKDLQERFPLDFAIMRASHWAVGWVDQLIVRVYDNDGEITEAFEAAMEWHKDLQDYAVADESHYSQMEYDETLTNIERETPAMVKIESKEDYEAIFSSLWEAGIYAEAPEYWYTEDEIVEAAYQLGMIDYDEIEDWKEAVTSEIIGDNNYKTAVWQGDEWDCELCGVTVEPYDEYYHDNVRGACSLFCLDQLHKNPPAKEPFDHPQLEL